MAKNNPFTLSFGKSPNEIISRYELDIYSIQNDPALTFLLRTPKIKLEPLSLAQITKTYQKVFETDLDMSKKLSKTTKGYAFAFQALGLLYFDYRDSLPLEKILLKFDDLLDDFVYRKNLAGASPQHGYVEIVLPRFAEVSKYYVE